MGDVGGLDDLGNLCDLDVVDDLDTLGDLDSIDILDALCDLDSIDILDDIVDDIGGMTDDAECIFDWLIVWELYEKCSVYALLGIDAQQKLRIYSIFAVDLRCQIR